MWRIKGIYSLEGVLGAPSTQWQAKQLHLPSPDADGDLTLQS